MHAAAATTKHQQQQKKNYKKIKCKMKKVNNKMQFWVHTAAAAHTLTTNPIAYNLHHWLILKLFIARHGQKIK